jgi:peptidoglycan hydrolase-like protein with peptidoglycan-binding domain
VTVKRFSILVALLAVLAVSINAFAYFSPRAKDAPVKPETVVAPPAAQAAAPLEVLDDEPPRIEPVAKPSASPSPVPKVDDGRLKAGSKGEAVMALEQRLSDLKYLVGKVDGSFDANTRHGVIAFQKVEGLSRSGIVDDATSARLATASTPAPKYSSPANHIEVDIPRQVVFVVRGGAVSAIVPTSTGTNKNFTADGWTRRAITPNGRFTVTRKINGMRISPLGELYKPSYFNGGIAFHGSGSIPTSPASHGCVRLPMGFADWFFNEAAPVGQVVFVHGGPTGPNPQPTIEDAPAPVASIPTEAPIVPPAAEPPPPVVTMPPPPPPAVPPAPQPGETEGPDDGPPSSIFDGNKAGDLFKP